METPWHQPLCSHLYETAGSRMGFPGGSDDKESLYNAGGEFDPWVGKNPWRTTWQPTPVFLPGESHGKRGVAGCSPWGRKEWDTAEQLPRQQDAVGLCGRRRWEGVCGVPLLPLPW